MANKYVCGETFFARLFVCFSFSFFFICYFVCRTIFGFGMTNMLTKVGFDLSPIGNLNERFRHPTFKAGNVFVSFKIGQNPLAPYRERKRCKSRLSRTAQSEGYKLRTSPGFKARTEFAQTTRWRTTFTQF